MNHGLDGFPNKENISKWGTETFIGNISGAGNIGSLGNIYTKTGYFGDTVFLGIGAFGLNQPMSLNVGNTQLAFRDSNLRGLCFLGANGTFGMTLRGNIPFSWSQSNTDSTSNQADTAIFRDASGIIGIRASDNSASNWPFSSPQTLRIYSTYTNSTTGGYLEISSNTGSLFLTTVASGSGTNLANFSLGTNRNNILTLSTGNLVGINTINPISHLDVSGHILAMNISGMNINTNSINNSTGNLTLGNNNSVNNIILSGGYINLYGNTSGTAPATTLLSLPISEAIYGDTTAFLGKPAGWLDLFISGRIYKLPYFAP